MIMLEERIGRLLQDLERMIYPWSQVIAPFKMKQTGERFADPGSLDTSGWSDMNPGQIWGGHRVYFWFDTEVTLPESMAGCCVVFELTTGRESGWDATNPQFLAYVNGQPVQGLDVNHRSIVLAEPAVAGSRFRLTLAAFTGDQNFSLLFHAQLRVLDRLTEKYYYDLLVPFRIAQLLDKQDQAYIDIILALNESLNLLDLRQEHSPAYYESLALAQEKLTAGFYNRLCGQSSPVVRCVGHTHIDVAWLWTLAVTEDKAVRTFSTMLALMNAYPEFIFMSSQPQLYKYVQKNAPEIFEKIRRRIKEGRWEAEGAMFLEADCNIASGEALVRQILTGKRYFRQEFGVDNRILWLPDVFGYSAALPQIMQKSGLSYFMTTKISWNEFNKMPYDTFEWIGIDGSRVLTHFIPTSDYQGANPSGRKRSSFFTTYNGSLTPSQVKGSWQRYQQKHLNSEVLTSFGFGDGGGGPTREMLETQRRLAQGIPGCPRTQMSTAAQFFTDLESSVRDNKYLPVWNGELYLEYHRGTYTSMARNKRYNRRAEFAWQNAEWACALNQLFNQADYPMDAICAGWEVVLRNQFHDILPGSSIKEVYDDSRIEYEQTLAASGNLLAQALQAVADRVGAGKLTIFNPTGFTGSGPVFFTVPAELKQPVLADAANPEVTCGCQQLADGRWLSQVTDIPAKGYRCFLLCEASEPAEATDLVLSPDHLANSCLDIRLNACGQFISIFDKRAGRELLPASGKANVLMSYEDKPHNYDAWDLNNYYLEKSWEIDDVQSITVTERGPVRGCLEIRRRYLDSEIVQTISLWRGEPRIDIHHRIDWHEKQIHLKALFPVDIHSSQATFDIQYGNVQRATHSNTSWDFARFEVCMHKWLDLSEDDFGCSVLNDCKYGCSVRDGVIGLSLLKSALYPNPDADKELHEFTLTLLPHQGGWRQAGTVRAAYLLNNPLIAVAASASAPAASGVPAIGGARPGPEAFSLVRTDSENVVVEVVKQAEDSSDWIIRLYECYNRRTPVRLTFAWPIGRICECSLLEEDLSKLEPVAAGAGPASAVDLVVLPYEIRTVKVRFAQPD
ncbi:MAG TPA: alpha-mannosidase [Clostridiales bacterium]|nr:alpha-mannosidase [Clostridiales bacterium]